MSSNDSPSGTGGEESAADESPDSGASASGDADADAPASADAPANGSGSAGEPADPEPTVPEGFGEVPDDREASRWGGYALAALLAVVFLLGLVRLTYPNASILVIGTLLAVFGLLVGLAAVWTRIRGS